MDGRRSVAFPELGLIPSRSKAFTLVSFLSSSCSIYYLLCVSTEQVWLQQWRHGRLSTATRQPHCDRSYPPLSRKGTQLALWNFSAALRHGAGNMVNAILRKLLLLKETDSLPLAKIKGDDRVQARALSIIILMLF